MIPALIFGYILGSIPFGLVIAKAMGLGDIRNIGSGNIGATNVLRTGNKGAAAATLLLDAGKGAAAVLIARALFGEIPALGAGLAAFIGHCYPVFLKFKGGKGVATLLGTLLAVMPYVGIIACATWGFTASMFRISSVAALATAAIAPLALLLFGGMPYFLMGLAMAVIVVVRHRENLRRLAEGTEPRIGRSK